MTAFPLRFMERRVVAIAFIVGLTLSRPCPIVAAGGSFAEALVVLVERAGSKRPFTVFADLSLIGHGRTKSLSLTHGEEDGTRGILGEAPKKMDEVEPEEDGAK